MKNRLALLSVWGAALCLFAVIASGIWMFIERNGAALCFPWPLDYGEGPLLDQAARLSRFENIYDPRIDEPPYTISNYPPVFAALQAPFVRLFGPSLLFGRAIGIVALIVAASAMALIVKKLTGDILGAVVAASFLFLFPCVFHWAALGRVDLAALGFACAGLAAVVLGERRKAGLVGGALLLSAAVFTRQSYGLAAPFAAFVFLLREPPRRRAFTLAAWTFGICLAAFAALDIATRHGFFLHVVTANINTFRWSRTEAYFTEFAQGSRLLLVAAALFLVAGLPLGRRRDSAAWWVSAPFLAAATVSALTSGKSGSNINYFIEPAAALALAAGVWVAWSNRIPYLRVIVLLLMAGQAAALEGVSRRLHYDRVFRSIRAGDRIAELYSIVKEADRPVLADRFMGLVPLSGKRLFFQPFEMKQLADAGLWNPRPFLDAIERKEFGAILIYEARDYDSRRQRWLPGITSYINRFYEPSKRLFDTVVYLPRKGANGGGGDRSSPGEREKR